MKIPAWMVVAMALMASGMSEVAWAARAHGRAPRRAKTLSEPAKPTRTLLAPEDLDKLRELLAGTDQATVISATTALGESSATNASLPLIELLAAGAGPPAAIAAVDALRKLKDPASIDVLALYASNRSPDTRRHAVEALGAFPEPRVVPTLLERLGDAAPDVRGAAAEALAARGDKSAAPRLLALLKRNDASAAAPLGAIAPVSLLPAIAELQGSIDDGNLATALGELLRRQDVAEPVRVGIIKTLARINGAASSTALIEYVATLPANDGRSSKVEAQKVIDERSKQK